jgi:hypothetical protein
MHGLRLEHLAVDGCITKAPCGGESARPRPTATGDGLLAARLDTITMVGMLPERPVVHLDAGYDDQPCRQVLTERGMTGEIATRGQPAPILASRRWPVERTHAAAAPQQQTLDRVEAGRADPAPQG